MVPRRLSFAFDLRAVIEQHLNCVHVAGARCHHQGRLAMGQDGGVGVGAGFQEFFDHRSVAVLGGEEHGRGAIAIRCSGSGAGVNEEIGGFEIVPASGPVEGGGAVGLGSVYVWRGAATVVVLRPARHALLSSFAAASATSGSGGGSRAVRKRRRSHDRAELPRALDYDRDSGPVLSPILSFSTPNICERGQQKIRRRAFGLDMTAALVLSHRAADQHVTDILVAVQVRVAHVTGPQNQRMVEQVAIAIGCRFQLIQEVRQALDVIAVDLGPVLAFLRNRAMVRRGMIGRRHARFRIAPHADVVRVHQRRYPRDVRLESQRLQVPHQLDVFGERFRHAEGNLGVGRRIGSPFVTLCSRRSISRMSSRYSLSRVRSVPGRVLVQTRDFVRDRIEQTGFALVCARAVPAALLPSPNSRSKTTCGLASCGSGLVGPDQETEFT